MTDLEMTRLCAEAMGWKHLGAVGVTLSEDERHSPNEVDKKYPRRLWCLSGGNDWWIDPDGNSVCGPCRGIPDPLHDDAQAMALVKKLRLSVGPNAEKPEDWWSVWTNEAPASEYQCADATDLNVAIVECVAKLKGAKL